MDECVAQLVYTNAHEPAAGSSSGQAAYNGDDTSATVLYVLADHNANVVGLTDDRGRLVGQYAYTPYGEIRAAECFTPDSGSLASAEAVVAAKGSVLGHQGLRTERFDRPWDGALDAATATAAYGQGSHRALNHNRNRMYDPAAGRFIEQDPNGLGIGVLDSALFRSAAMAPGDVAPDIRHHFGDGMNGHVAYACGPVMMRDASGCWSTAWMAPLAPGMAANLLWNALSGALLGGAMGGYMTGTWEGAAIGAGAGAAGGAAGAAASAFASSSGLLASLVAPRAFGAVFGGFTGGAAYGFLSGRSNREQLSEGLWAASVAGVLSQGGSVVARAASGADDVILASATLTSAREAIGGAVERAFTRMGPGSGSAWGTRVHTFLAAEIRALGRTDLDAEVSYLNGEICRYGKAGSVRADIVEGNPYSPTRIYDLKTGSASLTPARISEMRRHIPGSWTIEELR